MVLCIGKLLTAVESFKEASEVWCRFRDENDLVASESPRVILHDGAELFYISYNGRVWKGEPKDWQPIEEAVYDPYPRTEEEARDWHIRRDERNGRHTP